MKKGTKNLLIALKGSVLLKRSGLGKGYYPKYGELWVVQCVESVCTLTSSKVDSYQGATDGKKHWSKNVT